MTLTRQDDIRILSLKGDVRQGGWIASCTAEGDTDIVQYGDSLQLRTRSFSEFIDSDEIAFLNGHVLETPSFDFGALSSSVAFRVGTANNLMNGQNQTIGYASVASPSNNHQFSSPSFRIDEALTEFLENHCNFFFDATDRPDGIVFNTDINTSTATVSRFNIRKGVFWSTVQNQFGGGEEGGVIFHRPFFKRDNTFVFQPAPQFRSPAPTSKGTLTKEHIRGRPQVTVRNASSPTQVGQVKLATVDGVNIGTTYSSQFPATDPATGTVFEKTSGIWANSQAVSDGYAEDLYLWLTRPYTLRLEVDPGLVLVGDDGAGLDLTDRLNVTYNGPAEDAITGNGVHVDFDEAGFYIYGVDIRFSPDRFNASCILTLEADNS